jgi:leucyl aminopeptidase
VLWQVVSELKPANVKVVAALSMVRNSVGENCYVADEVIKARSGARVRVGNTDAEGRMIMADVLCYVSTCGMRHCCNEGILVINKYSIGKE